MTGEPHLARIDVLRGVAILMVLAFHAWAAAFGRDQLDWSDPDPWFRLTAPLRLGHAGVSLFFVVSGYVIHRSYLRDRTFTWAGYAARRFWRIYPAYLVALVAVAAWEHRLRTDDFKLHLALAHNLTARSFFGLNPSLWSLAVEVQLYLLYPLAVLARWRWGAGGLLAVGVAASTVWRLAAALTVGVANLQTYHIWLSPVALWPDWLLGAFLAERHLAGRRVFGRPAVAGWCGLAVAVELVRPLEAVQFTVASVAAAGLLELYLFRPGSPGRLARAVAWVGVGSYSLYLIHQPPMTPYADWLTAHGLTHPLARLAAFVPYLAVATGAAWLMYQTVERGGLWLGRRFTRRRPV